MRITKIRFPVQKPLCTLTYSATRTWPLRPSALPPDDLLTASTIASATRRIVRSRRFLLLQTKRRL